MRDVAKHAGVAVMTVSRVVNNSGYVSDEKRVKVEAAIDELGYIPNAVARSLRSSRTDTLALILGDVMNPFWGLVIEGAQQVARDAGFRIILCNTGNSFSEQREYLELVVERQVDGILLVPLPNSLSVIEWVQQRNIPIVMVDSRVPGIEVDTVRCDSETGAYQLTQLLINLGHERIAVLNGPREVTTMQDRVRGYRRALREAGLQHYEHIYYGPFDGAGGYQMAQRALTADPSLTALFATSNYLGYGALRYVRNHGWQVPEDITIASFDELPPEMNFDPFFTLVSQPALEMGRRAAELLIARLNGEEMGGAQEVLLPTEIILRRSSGPPPTR